MIEIRALSALERIDMPEGTEVSGTKMLKISKKGHAGLNAARRISFLWLPVASWAIASTFAGTFSTKYNTLCVADFRSRLQHRTRRPLFSLETIISSTQ